MYLYFVFYSIPTVIVRIQACNSCLCRIDEWEETNKVRDRYHMLLRKWIRRPFPYHAISKIYRFILAICQVTQVKTCPVKLFQSWFVYPLENSAQISFLNAACLKKRVLLWAKSRSWGVVQMRSRLGHKAPAPRQVYWHFPLISFNTEFVETTGFPSNCGLVFLKWLCHQ